MSRKLWLVFSAYGKELAAYTLDGTFAGEARATAELLAYEKGLDVSEIRIDVVRRY